MITPAHQNDAPVLKLGAPQPKTEPYADRLAAAVEALKAVLAEGGGRLTGVAFDVANGHFAFVPAAEAHKLADAIAYSLAAPPLRIIDDAGDVPRDVWLNWPPTDDAKRAQQAESIAQMVQALPDSLRTLAENGGKVYKPGDIFPHQVTARPLARLDIIHEDDGA